VSRSADPLANTREELYELVWSEPLVDLAQDFNLSDVALAKRCRKPGASGKCHEGTTIVHMSTREFSASTHL
jgi:hypothetical protein